MSQYPIAVFVGSLRRDSINRKLARGLMKLAPADLSFTEVEIGDLPLYNQDNDAAPPDSVKRLKADLAAAKGVLFVTPEYNRSIPGALKNAIDTASRPYGHNAFAGKPGAVIGASPGAAGTAMAQQHLRNTLVFVDVPLMAQPEGFIHATDALFEPDGGIGPGSRAFLQTWMNSYAAWVRKHAA